MLCTYLTAFYMCRGGTSRCEQAYTILKGSGTLNKDMRKWKIMELMEKIEMDVKHYEEKAVNELEHVIMDKKGFISKYVQKIESKETTKLLLQKLIITETSEKVPDPFHNIRGSGYRKRSSDEPVIGTKYI